MSPELLRGVIKISLEQINMWSDDAEELLLMTAAHETHIGNRLYQYPNGPALGIYQMEPETLYDIYNTYLHFRPKLFNAICDMTGSTGANINQLKFNPIYSTIFARLKYRRAPGKLPDKSDVIGMAEYAKANYNTTLGKATADKYLEDYMLLVVNNTRSKN